MILKNIEKPAIHGGSPVRTKPFPPWPVFGQEEEEAVLTSLRSGKWGKLQGDEVRKFEQSFASYHDSKYGIGVNNGSISLKIALLASGIRAGDEVIVTPYTFLASASSIIEVNAIPVFADIELETLNITAETIEQVLTPRTRAIMPVHLGGLPVDMDAIMALAEKHDLFVIEDAAHAHGSEYKGRRVGGIGHVGSFSFQSSKNLTCGEGGILITNHPEIEERCWSIHNCGRVRGGQWYEHHVIGSNFRLGELQGALLNAQFKRFDEQVERRNANGRLLSRRLEQVEGVMPQRIGEDCTRHSFHLFDFLVDPEVLGITRDEFIDALNAEGIPASCGYKIPLYRQPLFQDLENFGPFNSFEQVLPELNYNDVYLPNCETVCYRRGGWLEHHLLLGDAGDIDDIAAAFEKISRHAVARKQRSHAVRAAY